MNVIVCDLDGTLTEVSQDALHCMGATHTKEDILRVMDPVRIANLKLNEEIAAFLAERYESHEILINTGRWNLLHDITIAWLKFHEVKYHLITMRDHNNWKIPSVDVKLNSFDNYVNTRKVLGLDEIEQVLWIDDDNEMLRAAFNRGFHIKKVG